MKIRVIILLPFLVVTWLLLTSANANNLPDLKNGDLVFQTIKSSQTAAIMVASSSPYTHVGIVKIDESGNPLVVEAIGPVREIGLDEWIKQGVAGRITIKRMKSLTEESALKVLDAAKEYYGRPYDFYFYFDKESIYCSELVYYAFKDAMSIELGKIQDIKSLNFDNSVVKDIIEQRWKNYPLCKGRVDKFEKCYDIILDQKLVTPASVAEDKRFATIYSNYTPF